MVHYLLLIGIKFIWLKGGYFMVGLDRWDRRNLSSIVVDYIKEKILSGEYKEGDHISETKVAQELEMSRAPVREGIKDLQNQGLIMFKPNKGNYVARITMDDVKEIFDIRLLLEDSILEILIDENKLTEEDFIKLTSMVDDMVSIVNTDEDFEHKTVKINQKDIEFHRFIWEKSGSKRRVKILTDLFCQLQMAMVIDTKITGDLEKTAKDHYNIIVALREKDIEKSKKALRGHVITRYKKEVF
jgi:DNA-binding GntR family transcriptional regulator